MKRLPAPLRVLGLLALAGVLSLTPVLASAGGQIHGKTAQIHRADTHKAALLAKGRHRRTTRASTAAKAAVKPAAAVSQPAAVRGSAPGAAGVIVAIDPATGKLIQPSAEQVRALIPPVPAGMDRSFEGLVEIHKPDGTVGIDLQGRFADYAVVRMGPNGKPVFRCVHGEAELQQSLRDTLVSSPAYEKE